MVAATLVVLAGLLLPWYTTETITQARGGTTVRAGGSMSALGAFSFVEAGVVIVALALLALAWGRGTRRRFSLPFDDGTMVCAAATWIGLLIVYRLFATPDGTSAPQVTTVIGLNWGIFVSLLTVGLLFAAGLDHRRRILDRTEAERRHPQNVPDARPVVDPETIAVVVPTAAAEAGRVRAVPDRDVRPRAAPDAPDPFSDWPSRMPRPPRPSPPRGPEAPPPGGTGGPKRDDDRRR